MTTKTTKHRGLLSPVVTPYDENLDPDIDAWLAHCHWLLAQDCGLAVFGTNSEGNSLSLAERARLLDAAFEAGIDPARLMPGTGACSIPEAVSLTRQAVDGGAAGVLMLPPFYYKNVDDDGLFAFYSEVIQRVGDERLKIYLYHIPPVSQVPVSLDLIERLLAAYPGTIAGIKDSSGNFDNTNAMIERFDDFDVFVGSEEFLLDTLRAGGAGCISATANINPAAIASVIENAASPDAATRQAEITEFRRAVARFPMVPALKATVGIFADEPGWERMRPPLRALSNAQVTELKLMLEQFAFDMPGRKSAGHGPAGPDRDTD